MDKRLFIPVISTLLVIAGTIAAIQFAKGYRPDIKTGLIKGTGLLVANSFPTGAQVFIDGKLTTATDDTLNLPPGKYTVEVKKDGYTSWIKTLDLKAELVTQTNSTLFPSVPTLKPLTFTGAREPLLSPDGTKLVYLVDTATTPSKNGLWLIDLSDQTFGLGSAKEPRQLTRMTWTATNLPLLTWSPDSREVLVHLDSANYLVDASRFTDEAGLNDVTARLPVIFSDWEDTLARKDAQRLQILPQEMQAIATASATNLYFSPDEKKLLYTATANATIPDQLIPDLPSESTQPEDRELQPHVTYVYDLKEDKNYRVLGAPPAELGRDLKQRIFLFEPEATTSATRRLQDTKDIAQTLANFNAIYTSTFLSALQWFPTSNHLILVEPGKITIMEADGTNPATIFANTFEDNFVFPWPNGSQLIILTNLNQDSTLPANLYSLNLK